VRKWTRFEGTWEIKGRVIRPENERTNQSSLVSCGLTLVCIQMRFSFEVMVWDLSDGDRKDGWLNLHLHANKYNK
jgi:hypothetical protein